MWHSRLCLLFLGLSLLGWARFSSGAMSCSGQVLTTGGNYIVPHSNVTVPNIAGYTLLYTARHSTMGVGVVDANCDDAREFRFTVTDIPAGTVNMVDGYTVYPTSIKGIGISVNLDQYNTDTVLSWPNSLLAVTRESSESGKVDAIVTIRIWKTPEYIPAAGSLKFTGPKLVEYITSRNNGASGAISSCPAGSPRFNGDNHTCLLLSRVITGDVTLRAGTCDLVKANQVVDMGTHPGKSNASSGWKNASFRLSCLNAYGYGGGIVNSTNRFSVNGDEATPLKNTVKNAGLKLTIIPHSGTVNSSQGILGVTGGATGYGIQLAWGEVSTQTESPSRPVQLDTHYYVNTLSDDFAAGPYYFGTRPILAGKDGTVHMAARFVRTSATVTPGLAKAMVEVIATYE